MDIPWIRVISQCGVYVTFALYLIWAVRRGVSTWAPLLSAIGYAVLFEHWNMLRYAHVQGGYHYHAGSWIWLWGDVPLYIPLAWAFILATSKSITDQLRMRAWARPFSDALLALLIDVSMDAVAIRLKFWFWHGVGLNDGFFGVPADNFVGWLLVSFTFSALTRQLWQRREHLETAADVRRDVPVAWPVKVFMQVFVIPPVAYVLYLGLEAIVHVFYRLFHAQSLSGQLGVLLGTVLLFACAAAAGLYRLPEERLGNSEHFGALSPAQGVAVHAPRHTFHLFGVIGLLCVSPALRPAALWFLAASVWSIEWAISLFASRCASRHLERN